MAPVCLKEYIVILGPIVGKLANYQEAILRDFDTINLFSYLVDHLFNNLITPKHPPFFQCIKCFLNKKVVRG